MANVVEIIFRGVDNLTKEVNKINQGMGSLIGSARALASAFAGALAVQQFVEVADKMRLLENRLRIVTDSFGNLGRIQQELFQISQQTRSSLEGVGILYARIALNAEQMGLSQRTMLDLTRAVNEAVQISGGTAQEASAGIIQFSQAIASGVLRGDELRSITEQMPRLAKAIADGMGVSVGELRRLGAEGELTATRVISALESQFGVLNQEFGTTVSTVGQGLTTLGNSFSVLIQKIDRDFQVSRVITSALSSLTDFIDDFATTEAEDQLSKITAAIDRETPKLKELEDRLNALREFQQSGGLLAINGGVSSGGIINRPGMGFNALSDEQRANIEAAGGSIQSIELAIMNAEEEYQKMDTLVTGLREELVQLGVQMELTGAKTSDLVTAKVNEQVEKLLDALKEKAETLGFNSRELDLYKASLAGATAEQLALVNALHDTIDAYEREQERITSVTEAMRNGMFVTPIVPEDFMGPVQEGTQIGINNLQDMTEVLENMTPVFEETSNAMTSFADQAARNIQDVFADFLFDPFEEGMKGMLKGFVDVLRRMLAEALAANILQAMFGGQTSSSGANSGLSTILGSFFGLGLGAATGPAAAGGLAVGGWTSPGAMHPINEREPEFLISPNRSQVVPLSKMAAAGYPMGGGTYAPSTVVNVQGSMDPLQLEALLRRHEEKSLARFKQMSQDGQLT